MHFLQRCCVFIAITEIIPITIHSLSILRDTILCSQTISSNISLDSDEVYWEFANPVIIVTEGIFISAAALLYKGSFNKNVNHFLPWIIINGIFASLATFGCFITYFLPPCTTSLFALAALASSFLWGKWILVTRCRDTIKNYESKSQHSTLYTIKT